MAHHQILTQWKNHPGMDNLIKTLTIITKKTIMITVKKVGHPRLVNTHEIWIRQVEVGIARGWVTDNLQQRKSITTTRIQWTKCSRLSRIIIKITRTRLHTIRETLTISNNHTQTVAVIKMYREVVIISTTRTEDITKDNKEDIIKESKGGTIKDNKEGTNKKCLKQSRN